MKPTEKNKQQEPFDPKKTPQPPQVKDPNLRKRDAGAQNQEKRSTTSTDTGKRLGDETEITDETTI
jgi:hypothetical protein